jgi:hypothetical protein
VAVEQSAITFQTDTVDMPVERVSSLAGPLATLLQAASPDQVAALRRTAADLAAPYVTTASRSPDKRSSFPHRADPIAEQLPPMYPPT